MKLMPRNPVNLSHKGIVLAVVSCFIVIFIMAWITRQFTPSSSYPLLIASMGASAVILFIIPTSPLAQPWPLLGGQLISTIIGIASAQTIPDTVLASATAVSGSILAMLLLRCLHPPGAASALAPILSGDPILSLGYGYVLLPVGLNVVTMLAFAIVINRWLLGHEYPLAFQQTNIPNKNIPITPFTLNAQLAEQDLTQALLNRDTFLDVSVTDLSELLADAQRHSFKRSSGSITCADIMVGEVLSVEYGTEVEAAWEIMRRENLKALPVIDKARHVIGIVTWHNLFKFVSVDDQESLPAKFRKFVRRTPDITTHKPEAVGHIMTVPAATLKASNHIADLIPLMSTLGYGQIPIVNPENRLVGMVYQTALIAALYHLYGRPES